MLGSAIATTTSILVMNPIIVAEVYHVKGFTPFNRKVWKPIAASIPALLLTYLGLQLIFPAGTPVWAMIPGGVFYAGLYGLTFLALGGLEEEDRKSIRAAGRKFGYEEEVETAIRHAERLAIR